MRVRENPPAKVGQLKAIRDLKRQDIKPNAEGGFTIQVGNMVEVEITASDALILIEALTIPATA